MLSLLKWLFFLVISLILLDFSLSNHQHLTVSLFPLPFEAQMPLFLIVFSALALGIMVGSLFTYLSKLHWRKDARKFRIRADSLERELAVSKTERAALLEKEI